MKPAELRERALQWQGRLVADARFRRWAERFPITRPVARRRARELFDLCAGFVYSQVLYACVRLGAFEALQPGSRSVEDLAREMSLPVAAAQRLLGAAVSLRLARRGGDGLYSLGRLGAAMADNQAVAAMVEHHRLLYGDLADPVALLRREQPTALSSYWAYAGGHGVNALSPSDVAPYTELMSASLPLIADEVLDAFPLGDRRRLLDVGGGEGGFLATAAKRYPRLELVLFDAPAVAARAHANFEALGLASRAVVVGGDFLSDALPAGADIATMVRVLHDHDDSPALALLRSVRRALPSGGAIVVAEPMAGAAGAEPVGAAYFTFYLLAMGQGRSRTPGEIRALLAQAGFVRPRELPTRLPLQAGIVVAEV